MANTLAQGSTIALSNGASPEVYTAIGSATGFNYSGGSRTVHDATVLSSTAKEKSPGLFDSGQLTVNYKFQASDATLVDSWDAVLAGSAHNWRVTLSDSPATTYTFPGFITGMPFDSSTDSLVQGSFTIEISGAIVDNLA